MAIKLQKSLCINLENSSTLTINKEEPVFYSKKCMHQEDDVFRVGVKMPEDPSSNPVIIFFLTTNLQKLGLKVKDVISWVRLNESHLAPESRETKMNEIDITTKENEEENVGTQLFTDDLRRCDLRRCSRFIFSVKAQLTGIVDNYRVHQTDGFLSQQMWSSITDQLNGADFKLISNDGKSFPVHKWMLAARSPVFAALFVSDEEKFKSFHLAADCSFNEMSLFIKFIYTGELDGLVSHELMKLAAKYQIKTLEDICRTALQDAYILSADKMALIALHMKSGSYSCNNEEEKSELDMPKLKQENISIFTCTWNVMELNWSNKSENQETIKMSVPFEHGGKKLFRAELEMWKNPTLMAYNLKFLSFGHGDLSCEVDEVVCSIHQEESSLNQRIEMKEDYTDDESLFLILSATQPQYGDELLTTPLSCPFVITFEAKLRGTIPSFVNKMIDSSWSEQIWTAAVNRQMTDVEFLVGEESFGAHRSLISARSPVFAAMFESGMKEAATGQVRIEDVDPTTFQQFLKFLYTGVFEPSSLDRELFTVADKYRVETLMELCRPATKIADVDHIFKTFLSP